MKKLITIKDLNLIAFLALLLSACHPNDAAVTGEAAAPVTPVQVTEAGKSALSDYTEINAVSAYLQKSYVKANINGYIQSVNAVIGKQVSGHEVLFSLVTKEAKAIGNTVNQLDPAFKFSGVSKIRADQSGFISEVSHQKGDYVQDGEALAVIINQNSLVFLLDLPYEFRNILSMNKTVELSLPDGEKIRGTLGGSLPAVDSAGQTQRIIIHVQPGHNIPENLIAKVKLVKTSRPNAQTLPKSAVLSNETEDQFWVMKMINDSTAVKILVKKGIENDSSIEIISPVFRAGDRIIITGNYGIADTAKVKILK